MQQNTHASVPQVSPAEDHLFHPSRTWILRDVGTADQLAQILTSPVAPIDGAWNLVGTWFICDGSAASPGVYTVLRPPCPWLESGPVRVRVLDAIELGPCTPREAEEYIRAASHTPTTFLTTEPVLHAFVEHSTLRFHRAHWH